MLIALRDHIEDTGWSGSEDGPTAKRIEAYFLKNMEEDGIRQYKLRLRRHDDATLRTLLDRSSFPTECSEHLRDNYEFFRDRFKEVDLEQVYRGIGRLAVVDVTLDRSLDDPQMIFESLNSTGLDLSQSDLIRNFILMRLPEKEQTRLYDEYWHEVENLFRGSERSFDMFVRDFIALRTQPSKQEKADQIYFAFRREFSNIGSETNQLEELLSELLRYARYHAAFSVGTATSIILRDPLQRLRSLVDVPAMLIMRLFNCFERVGTLSEEEFVEAVDLIESFVFRRAICGRQTRGYWLEFAKLSYRIDDERPLESLKVGFARLSDNYAFPGDNEFRKALETADVYHKRVCFHLLDRLENAGSREWTDTSNYTIEHVLPQNGNLVSSWRKMLGKTWQDVQREWLHRLGNLTLTGYNSTYSDRPFEDKKTIKGGFEDSSVRLNKFIREQQQWTDKQIRERGISLAKNALEIWPRLKVEQSIIDRAKEADMREQAEKRDPGKVPMSQQARSLFEFLRGQIKELDSDVIELSEPRSVSYHAPTFFLEVLPRKSKIGLLLAMDFNEVEDRNGLAQDTAEWKFFVNAQYDGGVYIDVESEEEVGNAIPIVRRAYELTKA